MLWATCIMQDELPALAKSATEVEFKPGQSIIKQGEEGNEFFMIKPLASFYVRPASLRTW